ncbi:unnamed protein product, partial [Laminaria digitata]
PRRVTAGDSRGSLRRHWWKLKTYLSLLPGSCKRIGIKPLGSAMPRSRRDDGSTADSGAWLATRQMGAMLRKNALLKRADWRQTTAEVAIPALFMLLLVWIKSLTTVYDSPAAGYSCGQTIPWQYEDRLNPATFVETPLFQCLQKPPNCSANNYYRDEGGMFEQMGLEGLFPTVGFMESGDGYPWYGLTVGDNSRIYTNFGDLTGVSADNPSMDLRSLAHRLLDKGQKAVIAIAPAVEDTPSAENSRENSGVPKNGAVDDTVGMGRGRDFGGAEDVMAGGKGGTAASETLAAEAFGSWLVDELGGPMSSLAGAVRVFPSEKAVIDYVRGEDYDSTTDDPKTAAASSSPSSPDGELLERDRRQDVEEFREWNGGLRPGEQGGKVGMAVIFNKAPLEGGVATWDYTLRFNYTYGVSMFEDQATCLYGGCKMTYKLPSTLETTASLERPPSSSHMFGYAYTGFLTIQKAVDEYILSEAAGERMYLNVSMGFFPEQAYRTDQFQQIIASTLGIFYMLAFLYPVSRSVRVLVSEKEGRNKEALRMMGLPDLVYHGSWLITFQAQWLVTNILVLLVVRTSVFRYSNKWLVFLWLEAVALSVMAFCFLLSTFFSRSKTAATLGSVIFFAAFFPYYYVGGEAQTEVSTKTWASLLAPTCLALGSDTFAAFEGGLVGVQVSNTNQSYEGRLPYVNMVLMLLVDAMLYFLLAWYLDQVIPSEFGTPRPWHFPISDPVRWLRVNTEHDAKTYKSLGIVDTGVVPQTIRRPPWGYVDGGGREADGDNDGDLSTPLLSQRRASRETSSAGLPGVHRYDQEGGAKVEPVGPQLARQVAEGRTVSTRGLVKVYGNGKVAVKGLDVDLFEGHISVLLGHNGAGKSTAISMITGTLPPTRGDAFLIRGKRLSSDLVGVRRSLGVCFQQNTLFDQLTVFQHLQLLAVVKGVRAKDVDDEAARMVSEVGLVEKQHTPASALSGGQKRKLSVALAFIGGSEVVVLDEPTSGMDPFSRRSTWSVLQRQRKGRVILLTTHFMDEADTLGDRIAIMAEGELQCMGSSLFLKGLYGVGYTLTVMRRDQSGDFVPRGGGRPSGFDREDGPSRQGSLMMEAEDGEDLLQALVLEFVPEAIIVSSVGKERNYRLPFTSASKFGNMFREMDARKEELGVAGYGVSVTTLEEVFLRVGHGSEELPDQDPLSNEGIPPARLPSVELSPSSPSPVTTSSSSSGGGGSSGDASSSDGGAGGGGTGGAGGEGRKSVGRGAQPGGAIGAGWEEEKGGDGCAASAQLLDGDTMMDSEVDWPSSDGKGRGGGGGAGAGGRSNRGMFWVHFKALVAKRATYGIRDKKSQFFQLIVPTLLFLLGLILLKTSRNAFDQPSLQLSPRANFNPGMPSSLRNPVPLDAPQDPSLARSVADRFDGVSVEGTAVSVPPGGATGEDHFNGCAQGAEPLVNMSNFLLEGAGVDERGATRYGAVVLDASSHLSATTTTATTEQPSLRDSDPDSDQPGTLVYGVLVNASAMHGAPIFMNLVNSAALQAIVGAKEGEGQGEGVDVLTAEVGEGQQGEGRKVDVLADAEVGEGRQGGGRGSGSGGVEGAARLDTGGNAGSTLPSITVRSSPLPRTRAEELARQTVDGFTTAIMVVISVCFLPASYAIFVVKERAVKAKHQQASHKRIISGVGVGVYWLSTFVFDVATYLVPCGAFLGLLYAFDVPSYTMNEGAVATFLLFLLYGPAVAPFTYCISFLFKSASSAQNMVLFINFVTGLALMVTSFVLNLVDSTKDVNAKLKWVYRLFPGFCLGDGLAQLVFCEDGKTCMDISSFEAGVPKTLTPLSWSITGADIACLLASSVGYLLLCFAIEYAKTFPKLLRWFSSDPAVAQDPNENGFADDEDVAAEALRVERMGGVLGEGEGEVVLRGLRKVYRTNQASRKIIGPKVAVHRLSFSVAKGDCFGFLGINGAGEPKSYITVPA